MKYFLFLVLLLVGCSTLENVVERTTTRVATTQLTKAVNGKIDFSCSRDEQIRISKDSNDCLLVSLNPYILRYGGEYQERMVGVDFLDAKKVFYSCLDLRGVEHE